MRRSAGLDTASAGFIAARLLYDLLSVYTPTGLEHKAFPVIERHASSLGLTASMDGDGNIVVEPPLDGIPVVALVGHVDTVKGLVEPYFDGAVVRGRGAVDAKGPLASMITGLYLAREGGLPCKASVIALAGEEGDSRGAWGILRRGLVPPLVIVGEPTGSSKVVVGYRGSSKVIVECRGPEGHSASLEETSIERLVRMLARALDRVRGLGARASITSIRGGSSWNVAPPKSTAVVDVRFEGSIARGVGAVEALCQEARSAGCRCLEYSLTGPARVEVSSPVPRALVAALRGEGVRPGIAVKHGTSDMNLLAPATLSIAAYGPGDPRLSHTSSEAVRVEELGVASRVYYRALARLCHDRLKALQA